MSKLFMGVVALIVGIALAAYGNSLNNDWEAQLASLWNNGTTNPGDTWLYLGLAVAVVGLVLTVLGIMNKSKNKN